MGLCLLLLLAPRVSAQTPSRRADSLATTEIRRQLDQLTAATSMYAVHPASGRTVDVRADVPMNTMSTIKIAIMLLAYRDADAGRFHLDERVTLRDDERRGGTGLLKRFAPGMTVTHRDLVDQMIITSDNTATDVLIGKLGIDRIQITTLRIDHSGIWSGISKNEFNLKAGTIVIQDVAGTQRHIGGK